MRSGLHSVAVFYFHKASVTVLYLGEHHDAIGRGGIGVPVGVLISTPSWNARSPEKGSVRSPNAPVRRPSTGHMLGCFASTAKKWRAARRRGPRMLAVGRYL